MLIIRCQYGGVVEVFLLGSLVKKNYVSSIVLANNIVHEVLDKKLTPHGKHGKSRLMVVIRMAKENCPRDDYTYSHC